MLAHMHASCSVDKPVENLEHCHRKYDALKSPYQRVADKKTQWAHRPPWAPEAAGRQSSCMEAAGRQATFREGHHAGQKGPPWAPEAAGRFRDPLQLHDLWVGTGNYFLISNARACPPERNNFTLTLQRNNGQPIINYLMLKIVRSLQYFAIANKRTLMSRRQILPRSPWGPGPVFV